MEDIYSKVDSANDLAKLKTAAKSKIDVMKKIISIIFVVLSE